MAGSFGFEKKKYDVSVQIGERVLLPKVRQADKDTLIITNGFSCQQQIEQLIGRKSLHIAEVLRMAITQRGERDHQALIGKKGEHQRRHYILAPPSIFKNLSENPTAKSAHWRWTRFSRNKARLAPCG
jgi:hypothetical protein